MKKIIMAVAAIAMAASMFAADVSAGTKIEGSLFKYDGGIHMLQEANGSQDYANPNFQFGVSGDRAGATVKITTKATQGALTGVGVNDDGSLKTDVSEPVPFMTTQTIWFKPFDMLKITVGNGDVALNKETIDWTGSTTGIDGRGFYLEFTPVDGLSIDVVLKHEQNGWFLDKPKDGDLALSAMYFKGAYSADFGSIGAYAQIALNNSMEFGAGWKNGGALGPVNTLFVNAIVQMDGSKDNSGFNEVRGEVFANMGFGSIGLGVFIAGGYFGEKNHWLRLDDYWRTGTPCLEPTPWNPNDKYVAFNKAYVGTVLKLSFPVGDFGGYLYIKDTNFLAEEFSMTVKPGLTGNMGAMGWELAVEITAKRDIEVNVPFNITISF